jgi:putative NADH-flavin reductase
MRLAIFGVTGKTGTRLLGQAIAKGHRVTVLVRDPARLAFQHQQLQVITGDVTDPSAVAQTLLGCEVALCVLGGGRVAQHRTAVIVGSHQIMMAMPQQGVRRLIAVTAAGAGDGWQRLSWPLRTLMKPFIWPIRLAKTAQEELIVQSSREMVREWIIVRPPRLTDKPATGHYRVGQDFTLGLSAAISRADLAAFMLANLDNERYLYQTPAIMQAAANENGIS